MKINFHESYRDKFTLKLIILFVNAVRYPEYKCVRFVWIDSYIEKRSGTAVLADLKRVRFEREWLRGSAVLLTVDYGFVGK